MARVNTEEVRLIFSTKELEDVHIMAFIQTANLMVTEVLVGEGLSDDRLKLIEQWLTAHLCAIRDRRHESRTVDSQTTLRFQGKTDMGLDSSLYGQQVKFLDTTGLLAEADAGLKQASIIMVNKQD